MWRAYLFCIAFAAPAFAKIDFAAEGFPTHAETIEDCRAALSEAKSNDARYMRRACMAQILGFWDAYLAFTEQARSITAIKDSCFVERQKFYNEYRNTASIPDAYIAREFPLQVSLLEKAVMNTDEMLNAWPVEKKQKFLKEYNEYSLPASQQYFTKDAHKASAEHALQLPFPTLNELHAICAAELESLKNSPMMANGYCLSYIQGMGFGILRSAWMIPVDPAEGCTDSQFVSEIAASKSPQCPMNRIKVVVIDEWKQFESRQPKPLRDGIRGMKLVEFLVTLGRQHPEILEMRGRDGKLLTVNSAVKHLMADDLTLCVPESSTP